MAANGNGKAPLVLIVDDDPAIRMLCSVNLRIEGSSYWKRQTADRRSSRRARNSRIWS